MGEEVNKWFVKSQETKGREGHVQKRGRWILIQKEEEWEQV